MDKKREFEKYRSRIVKEGILKSLFFGLMFGCFALVVVAFFTWFYDYKPGLFIAVAAFIAVTAGVTPIFYFCKYRPSVKEIARRVDALGLEERMLTMTELEGDDSFIAKTQREDTMRVLGSLDHMLLKIAIGAAIIVPLVLCCTLGVGMTTVSSLYYADVIPSGLVTLTVPYSPAIYTVTYSVEALEVQENGSTSVIYPGHIIYWTGNWDREETVSENGDKVLEGNDALPVYAIPDDGYVFVAWSDGLNDPYRQDLVVDGDIFAQAIFERMADDPSQEQSEDNAQNEQDGEDGEDGEEGEQGDQQDGGQSEGQDGQQGEGEGQQQEGEPQEGEPQDGEGQGEGEGDEGEEGEDQDGEGSDDEEQNQDGQDSNSEHGQPNRNPAGQPGSDGSRDLGSQQIVDGNTYYGDEFDDAYGQWKDRDSSDSNLPDDLKDFIEDYYGSIETGSKNP